MVEYLSHPAISWYVGSIVILLAMLVIEVVSAIAGMDIFEALNSIVPEVEFDVDAEIDVDVDIDTDIHGDASVEVDGSGLFKFLTWFSIGRVPFSIWLVLVLATYGIVGLCAHSAILKIVDVTWINYIIKLLLFIPTFWIVHLIATPLGKALMKNQTSAVGLDSLVGKNGTIEYGPCTVDNPVKAKVVDAHGHPHYVMVKPFNKDDSFNISDVVTLIEKCSDNIFTCQSDLTKQV